MTMMATLLSVTMLPSAPLVLRSTPASMCAADVSNTMSGKELFLLSLKRQSGRSFITNRELRDRWEGLPSTRRSAWEKQATAIANSNIDVSEAAQALIDAEETGSAQARIDAYESLYEVNVVEAERVAMDEANAAIAKRVEAAKSELAYDASLGETALAMAWAGLAPEWTADAKEAEGLSKDVAVGSLLASAVASWVATVYLDPSASSDLKVAILDAISRLNVEAHGAYEAAAVAQAQVVAQVVAQVASTQAQATSAAEQYAAAVSESLASLLALAAATLGELNTALHQWALTVLTTLSAAERDLLGAATSLRSSVSASASAAQVMLGSALSAAQLGALERGAELSTAAHRQATWQADALRSALSSAQLVGSHATSELGLAAKAGVGALGAATSAAVVDAQAALSTLTTALSTAGIALEHEAHLLSVAASTARDHAITTADECAASAAQSLAATLAAAAETAAQVDGAVGTWSSALSGALANAQLEMSAASSALSADAALSVAHAQVEMGAAASALAASASSFSAAAAGQAAHFSATVGSQLGEITLATHDAWSATAAHPALIDIANSAAHIM